MSVRGWATGCKLVNQGSELTADAAVLDTVLYVDWVGDFDDTGGTLRLNGVDLNYTGVDTAAETVTLAAPLAAAATTGDPVDVVTAGQVLKDYTLFVTTGVGDDIQVEIPFGDRDAWPEGDYDDPVEVLLSDDQERIESVPGVLPVRRLIGGYIATSDDDDASRMVIRDDGPGGIVEAFTGHAEETHNGYINPGVTDVGGAYTSDLILASGAMNAHGRAVIKLRSDTSDNSEDAVIEMTGTVIANGAILADGNLSAGGDCTVFGDATADHLITTGAEPTTDAANVWMGPGGALLRITSTRDSKLDMEALDLAEARQLLGVEARTWVDGNAAETYAAFLSAETDDDRPDLRHSTDLRRILGLVVDELETAGVEFLLSRDQDGVGVGVKYDRVAVALIPLVRDALARIEALEAKS